MSHVIKNKFIKNFEEKQNSIGYDVYMCNYINSIIAYNYLYNYHLEEMNSESSILSTDSAQKWEGMVGKLENNIKHAFQKLVINNSKFVDQAMQILEKTIKNGSRIAISGKSNNKENFGTKPLLQA